MIGKSRERCRPKTAEDGNGVRHVECKAEYGKGLRAALSTWSASCQGETLKDTRDILTVWTANPGPGKAPGTAWPYVFSLLMACLTDKRLLCICYLLVRVFLLGFGSWVLCGAGKGKGKVNQP